MYFKVEETQVVDELVDELGRLVGGNVAAGYAVNWLVDIMIQGIQGRQDLSTPQPQGKEPTSADLAWLAAPPLTSAFAVSYLLPYYTSRSSCRSDLPGLASNFMHIRS